MSAKKAKAAKDHDRLRWIGLQPEPDDSTERIEELLRQAQEQQPVGKDEEE